MISTPGGVFDAFIEDVSPSMTASGTPGGGAAADFRAIRGEVRDRVFGVRQESGGQAAAAELVRSLITIGSAAQI